MSKAVAVLQARMDSSRLPGKVLMDLSGKPVLQWCVDAARAIPGIDEVIVATSDQDNDEPIAEYCRQNEISVSRGSKENVLERMTLAAKKAGADIVMRLTADCPLLDPAVCGSVLYRLQITGCDYASNVDPVSWPDGVDCEVMTFKALETAHKNASSKMETEHVTPYILANRQRFKTCNIDCPLPGLSSERWTLDNQGDYDFLQGLTGYLKGDVPPSYIEVLQALKDHPELRDLRKSEAERSEGEDITRAEDGLIPDYTNFKTSEELLERALKTVPLGTQTFSRSHLQFPPGGSPLFLTHGRGGRVWDVDGNEYVDMICGLLPVSLGYCDPDVDAAVKEQLGKGVTFSLATELEAQLAEKLREIVPCADMARFGKNGTDATSACIRLARAHTGRDHVIACGYHGWQDWYIGSTTRNLGVPDAVSKLTHRLPHNDIDALKKTIAEHKGQIAAIIMEAASGEEPHEGYLEEVRQITEEEGIVLIFDEIIMGFRIHLGGAGAYYGVKPDLAAFGKGMANGMPLSAVVGSAEIMDRMNDIFYSGTFGGETLSLAASLATIDKMQAVDAVPHMHKMGRILADKVTGLIKDYELEHVFQLIGIDPWKIMAITGTDAVPDNIIQTRFLTEMFRRGILSGGTHNICYAHTETDIAQMIGAYDQVLRLLKEEISAGTVEKNLHVTPIQPVFKVRN